MIHSSIYHHTYYKSPIGWIKILDQNGSLVALKFSETTPTESEVESTTRVEPIIEALNNYFKNDNGLCNMRMDPQGTPFQKNLGNSKAYP